MIQLNLPTEKSYLVICPWCFDCWARIEGEDISFWQHRYVPCLHHPQAAAAYGIEISGSLIEAEPELIDVLPAELITREFKLWLNPESDLSSKHGRMLESALELPGQPIGSSSRSSASLPGQENPSGSPLSSQEFLSLDPISSDAFSTD